jgi:Protein of unknown function (DUF2523)
MFGIVLSALNVILGFVFRSVIIKFGLFFALFFVASEFIQFITSCNNCIPGSSSVSSALSAIPSSVWYFLNLFKFSQGIVIIFSALAVRFLIRRIPFFG